MSATMPSHAVPAAFRDHPVESPRLVAVPPPVETASLPVTPPTRARDLSLHIGRPSATTKEKLNVAALNAVWMPALVVAGAVGAVALAIAQPIALANELRKERRYR
jgi:hypothetical protein